MTPQTLGKYTLLRKLATGGMAEVFLARADGPMGFQKKLVVKRILPHFVEDEQFVQMFLGEATIAAQLDHPNIVQIFDFGEVDRQYYLAMEYIDGPNLRALNRVSRDFGQPLSFEVAARLISLAADGLHAAHEAKSEDGQSLGLVHRDISPDNIMLARSGAVKVVDFGIAKATTGHHKTKSGVIKGKMAYMPPEQLAREEVDRRADVFALGVTLYDLVAGELPFDATSEVSIIQAIMGPAPFARLEEKRADVPVALDAIVAKCLEKKPEARYASCRELQADLEKFISSTGKPVLASELTALVDRFFPTDDKATVVQGKAEDAFASTVPSQKSQPRAEAQLRPDAQAMAAPAAATVSPSGVTGMAPAVGRSPWPVVAGVALLVAVGAVGVLLLRPSPSPEPTPARVLVPAVEVPVAAVLPEVLEFDGGAAEVIDAGQPDAGPVLPAHVAASSPRLGKLELRIRPFAEVYLDGKKLGETPLPPVPATVGKHKLRLVNPTLGKDVEVDVTVTGASTVFKYNFKE
jgi:eukaryotic-like serine/threonine-protein kinase